MGTKRIVQWMQKSPSKQPTPLAIDLRESDASDPEFMKCLINRNLDFCCNPDIYS